MMRSRAHATLGPTTANILVGIASAIVDNIPLMFAVLSINPEMSPGQWLLVAGWKRNDFDEGLDNGAVIRGRAIGFASWLANPFCGFRTDQCWPNMAEEPRTSQSIRAMVGLNPTLTVPSTFSSRFRFEVAGDQVVTLWVGGNMAENTTYMYMR